MAYCFLQFSRNPQHRFTRSTEPMWSLRVGRVGFKRHVGLGAAAKSCVQSTFENICLDGHGHGRKDSINSGLAIFGLLF